MSLRLWKLVPPVTQVFEKPTWSYKSQSSAINHLDEVWEIKQRMEECGNSFTQAFEGSFAATLFISTLRYPRLQSSHLPLSPRLASFLLRCLEAKLGREGCIIACILECGAASFDVQLAGQLPMIKKESEVSAKSTVPILLLLRILENVSLFLSEIRIALASKKLTLKEAKIIPRRLRKAEQLWWKIHAAHRCKPSRLSDEDQVKGQTDLLVDTFPEQVAVLASDGKWYSGGCRVRGQELKSMVDAQEIFFLTRQ